MGWLTLEVFGQDDSESLALLSPQIDELLEFFRLAFREIVGFAGIRLTSPSASACWSLARPRLKNIA